MGIILHSVLKLWNGVVFGLRCRYLPFQMYIHANTGVSLDFLSCLECVLTNATYNTPCLTSNSAKKTSCGGSKLGVKITYGNNPFLMRISS